MHSSPWQPSEACPVVAEQQRGSDSPLEDFLQNVINHQRLTLFLLIRGTATMGSNSHCGFAVITPLGHDRVDRDSRGVAIKRWREIRPCVCDSMHLSKVIELTTNYTGRKNVHLFRRSEGVWHRGTARLVRRP